MSSIDDTIDMRPSKPPPRIRTRWLNALIIGTAILVWLMLASVVVGVVVTGLLAHQIDRSNAPVETTYDPDPFKDPSGNWCWDGTQVNGYCQGE